MDQVLCHTLSHLLKCNFPQLHLKQCLMLSHTHISWRMACYLWFYVIWINVDDNQVTMMYRDQAARKEDKKFSFYKEWPQSQSIGTPATNCINYQQYWIWSLGCGIDHPPPSIAEVEGRVELQICFPSGPSWPITGRPLPLLLLNFEHKINLENNLYSQAKYCI